MGNCLHRLSDPVTWVEGECFVKDLISTLVNVVTTTPIKTLGGEPAPSKWGEVYYEREHSYVTYTVSKQSRSGKYIQDNGKESIVYRITDPGELQHKADDGYYYEAVNDIPVGRKTKDSPEYRTGKRISYDPFYHNGEAVDVINSLVTLVDMYPNRDEKTFENRWDKYQAYIVEHSREDYLGNDVADTNWNYYKIVAPLPDDWTYAVYKKSILLYRYTGTSGDGSTYTASKSIAVTSSYSVEHFFFSPTLHRVSEKALIALDGTDDDNIRYVYFEKPLDSNNYIKVGYMVDSMNNFKLVKLKGDPESSYKMACEIENGVPKVINENEAYRAYERQINDVYAPGEFFVKGTRGASFNMNDSLYSYWFISGNSSLAWLPNKMRDAYSLVRYSISLNNKRVIAVLEGDANYDPDSAYISFAHIGEFKPLDSEDVYNNFAVTVGMGEPSKSISGFDYKDIDKKTNPIYAQYGRFTSNGMDTISVAKGKSNLQYQEYRPAFLTHLPNYPNIGTMPKGLQRLDVSEHFQISSHTNHAHASPIYLVDGYEGYRGYLDGVVALYDRGVVAGDELEYKIEGYTETYVVFKLISPINFLDKSAAPKNMIIAILKEIN